jgi:hypothetical protein
MRRDVGAAVAAGLMAVAAAHGQALPTMDASGTVHAPASTVPVSSLLTPEAKAAFIARYTAPARRKPGDFAPADGHAGVQGRLRHHLAFFRQPPWPQVRRLTAATVPCAAGDGARSLAPALVV